MLKKINLQLFAEDDEIEIDENDEIEIEDDSIEVDLDDAEDEEIKEEKPEKPESEEEQEKKEQDVVSKKAFLAERRKFQKREKEYKRQLEEIKKQINASSVDPAITTLINEGGLSEDMAKVIAKVAKQDSGKADSVEKLVNKKFMDLEFERLKDNPDYADIEDFREEIEEMAADKGLTLKQAYNVLLGDEKITKTKSELRREIEQEVLANVNKRQGYKDINTINNGDRGDIKTTKYKLSEDELEIAKAGGMTPKEYYMSKNASSIGQLDKIFKKKKG